MILEFSGWALVQIPQHLLFEKCITCWASGLAVWFQRKRWRRGRLKPPKRIRRKKTAFANICQKTDTIDAQGGNFSTFDNFDSFDKFQFFTILGSLNTFYSFANCYTFDMLTHFVNLDNFYTFNNTEISKVLWDLLMYLKN